MSDVEKIIEFEDYSVSLYPNSITFINNKDKRMIRIPSDFRVNWNRGEPVSDKNFKEYNIKIENIYMTLFCWFPHEQKQMFDFVGRGFNVFENLFKEIPPQIETPPTV